MSPKLELALEVLDMAHAEQRKAGRSTGANVDYHMREAQILRDRSRRLAAEAHKADGG
jgi:hypothetical protein